MTNSFTTRLTALGVGAALVGLASTAAFADEIVRTGAVIGQGAVGALYYETKGLATSAADVARQGGAATAATVRWTNGKTFEEASAPATGAYYGAGTVGAMVVESAGVATGAAAAGLQGGRATAGAVRWVEAPAAEPKS